MVKRLFKGRLSSLPTEDVENLGRCIRRHWGIENRLHWHRDVTFGEDGCRARREHSVTNLNTLRKYALVIVSNKKDYLSVKKRLF